MTDTTQEPPQDATKQADATESTQVKNLRKESASYRLRAKDAETKLAEAEKRLHDYEERDRAQAEEQEKRERLNALEAETGIPNLGDLIAGADIDDEQSLNGFVAQLKKTFTEMRSRGIVADQSARTGEAIQRTDPLKAALKIRRS